MQGRTRRISRAGHNRGDRGAHEAQSLNHDDASASRSVSERLLAYMGERRPGLSLGGQRVEVSRTS
jgi:hypothetical protein